MKKILLTTTLALLFNCFLSFQASAGDDARYPAYDFKPTILYRSPELSASLSPKPVSKSKPTPRKKIEQSTPKPTELKSKQPPQTKTIPSAPAVTATTATASTHTSNPGLSFGNYLMIAIILLAAWAAFRDNMALKPQANAQPTPPTTSQKPSKPRKKQGNGILVLSDNTTQCQAKTGKGTRCKRNNDLQLKRHAVNQRNCQFAVCKQHDRDSFKPHPSVLQGL